MEAKNAGHSRYDRTWLDFGQGLAHFEQNVNDRSMTSPAPSIDSQFLPENRCVFPLKWRKLQLGDVCVFQSEIGELSKAMPQVLQDEFIFIPIHPLEEHRHPAGELITSGHIRFSASYRTVFFEPQSGGLFDKWIPDDRILMIKMHLQEPLPGIDGDRRLTRDKIEKCVLFSDLLSNEIGCEQQSDKLEIVPEILGVSHEDTGVLFRLMPRHQVIPLFALYSRDRTDETKNPIIVAALNSIYGRNSAKAASDIGRIIAKPLVRSLISGFLRGFSLEMHAQNTLVRMSEASLIDRVFFRDLEGVILSNTYRAERGLEPLCWKTSNAEILDDQVAMRRWFNRNIDHDLARIFMGILNCLRQWKVFDESEVKIAIHSIRKTVRKCIVEGDMTGLSGHGRLLPFSRSPYGNGTRLGHFYRTTFR